MASARNCPRCQAGLAFPEPRPEKIVCAACGATIRLGPARAAAPLPVSVGPPVPQAGETGAVPAVRAEPLSRRQNRAFGLMLALGGLVVLAVAGIWIGLGLLGNGKPDDRPIAGKEVDMDKLPGKGSGDQSHLSPEAKKAVDKGVAYLKKRLLDEGKVFYRFDDPGSIQGADFAQKGAAHVGAVALAGLTLLECGVSPDDPAIQESAKAIRKASAWLNQTYCLATSIWFLNRLHLEKSMPAEEQKIVQSLALRLVAGQSKNGLWGYSNPTLSAEQEKDLLGKLHSGNHSATASGYTNTSNSQFAALALWTARKHGIPVHSALLAASTHIQKQQIAGGTWNYDATTGRADSATCAGLILFALGKGIEDEPDAGTTKPAAKTKGPPILQDPIVLTALKYLENTVGKAAINQETQAARLKGTLALVNNWKVQEEGIGKALPWGNEQSGTLFGVDGVGDLYFLWSLERVAVIYDLKVIGGKDWHAWGSKFILESQKEDGSWFDRFAGVPDTCFALLFLKRVNIAKDLTDKLKLLAAVAKASSNPTGLPPRKEA